MPTTTEPADNTTSGRRRQREAMLAAARDLYDALKAVEWVLNTDPLVDEFQCPECHAEKPNHYHGCRLAAALRRAEEVRHD